MPSKTLLAAARAASIPARLRDFGLGSDVPVQVNTTGLMRHIRDVIAKVAEHETAEVLTSYGIEVIAGDARFVAPDRIDVDGRAVIGRRFVIATGSRPAPPAIPGLDHADVLTSDTLWDTDTVPSSLAILGGGPVAVEMASAFTRLGVRVHMIVRSRLLKAEEPEIAERLSAVLTSQGVDIVTGVSVERVESDDRGVDVIWAGGRLRAERLLVATGRGPVVPPGLDQAGVRVDKHGIVTDAHMRTTARHIFAAGDVTGPFKFTHTAERQGIAAATNALLPTGPKVTWDDILWVLFTEPELAHLGMTEEQAREAHGDSVRVRRYDFGKQDRAKAESATTGLAKFILDHRGHLLGAHILGERAGELIHEAAILLHNDMPLSSLSRVLHAYPTFTDAMKRPADAEYAKRLRDNPVVRVMVDTLVGHDRLAIEP